MNIFKNIKTLGTIDKSPRSSTAMMANWASINERNLHSNHVYNLNNNSTNQNFKEWRNTFSINISDKMNFDHKDLASVNNLNTCSRKTISLKISNSINSNKLHYFCLNKALQSIKNPSNIEGFQTHKNSWLVNGNDMNNEVQQIINRNQSPIFNDKSLLQFDSNINAAIRMKNKLYQGDNLLLKGGNGYNSIQTNWASRVEYTSNLSRSPGYQRQSNLEDFNLIGVETNNSPWIYIEKSPQKQFLAQNMTPSQMSLSHRQRGNNLSQTNRERNISDYHTSCISKIQNISPIKTLNKWSNNIQILTDKNSQSSYSQK